MRVPRQIALRHKTTKRLAQHDRLLKARCFAQTQHVVSKGIQCPFDGWAPVVAAMAAVVHVDDLCNVGQAAEDRLETAVVVTRPTVQQHQAGFFAHQWAISMRTERCWWVGRVCTVRASAAGACAHTIACTVAAIATHHVAH
jgi:hypothetical protein